MPDTRSAIRPLPPTSESAESAMQMAYTPAEAPQIPSPAPAGSASGATAGPLSVVRAGLVVEHRPLVGHIVRDMLSRLPAHVDRADLLSAGLVALTVAARTWEPDRAVPFARYAAIRVRGAITDELRSLDWATRGVRSRARTIADARASLQSTLGRAPSTGELEQATGFSSAEIAASAADTARAGVLSLDTPAAAEAAATLTSPTASSGSGTGTVSGWGADPAVLLVQREQWGYLQDAIETLPDRLRFVVRGYFFEQRPMAELAAVLGVTDSRISQLRAEAVRMLHAALAGPLHDATTPPEARTNAGAKLTGPSARVTAARQAYVAAVAARSSTAARLRHTNAFAEPRLYDPTESADGFPLQTAG